MMARRYGQGYGLSAGMKAARLAREERGRWPALDGGKVLRRSDRGMLVESDATVTYLGDVILRRVQFWLPLTQAEVVGSVTPVVRLSRWILEMKEKDLAGELGAVLVRLEVQGTDGTQGTDGRV